MLLVLCVQLVLFVAKELLCSEYIWFQFLQEVAS